MKSPLIEAGIDCCCRPPPAPKANTRDRRSCSSLSPSSTLRGNGDWRARKIPARMYARTRPRPMASASPPPYLYDKALIIQGLVVSGGWRTYDHTQSV